LLEALCEVIRGIPRWAEALRSEIKKHRDLLTKLEEQQHNKDSRRKASAQQFIFEFGIKGMRRVLNKHNKATTMGEVYWECPIGFRWAWSDKDTPPADRMKAQDVLSSLQEQMMKTGEKYTLVVDSEGIRSEHGNTHSHVGPAGLGHHIQGWPAAPATRSNSIYGPMAR